MARIILKENFLRIQNSWFAERVWMNFGLSDCIFLYLEGVVFFLFSFRPAYKEWSLNLKNCVLQLLYMQFQYKVITRYNSKLQPWIQIVLTYSCRIATSRLLATLVCFLLWVSFPLLVYNFYLVCCHVAVAIWMLNTLYLFLCFLLCSVTLYSCLSSHGCITNHGSHVNNTI